MLKKSVLFVVLGLLTVSSVMAAKVPKWLDDKNVVYPEEKYISRLGRAQNLDAAKAKALADIAGYFKSQVVAETKATQKMVSSNGVTSKYQEIDQTTEIKSQMDLVAVDYSDFFYNKKEDMYYVVAFIDREIAWSAIEPELLRTQNNYESLYDLAIGTKEPILRYKYLYKSREAGMDLINRLYFGFLINPSKKQEFSQLIYEISNDAVFGALDAQDIPLYLNVIGDQGGIVTSAITEIFSTFGFIVGTTQSNSSIYTLTVTIDDNEVVSDDIHAIYPYLEIKLTNRAETETFYTWNKRWTKTANFSLRQCQQRAYPKMVEDVKKLVPDNYKEHLKAK